MGLFVPLIARLDSNYAVKGIRLSKRIEVVGAVFVREGKILACKRSESMSLTGYWEFPGGKIKPDESPEKALRRELLEELRCDAKVGKHLETTEYDYDFGTVVLSTYFCSLQGTKPVLTEHAEMRWLAVDELETVQWAPADVPAVQRLKGSGF